ncbi:MAG: ABC transporter substrate binding protein [Candidatus Dependentiae bacterium]
MKANNLFGPSGLPLTPRLAGAHIHHLHDNPESPHGTIALIVSDMHNSQEVSAAVELSKRLIKLFGEQKVPSMDIISPQGSVGIMRGHVSDTLAHGQYGSIVTFSSWTAHAISNEFERSNMNIPFVFTNMHSIANMSALDTLHPARNYAVGISVKHPKYTKTLGLLGDWFPEARRALVILGKWQAEESTGELHMGLTKENIAICEAQGIAVEPLYAYDHNDLSIKLENRLEYGRDIILTGDNVLALSNGEMLAHFAELNKVPVVTQSLEVVKVGHAALGCGVWGCYTNGLVADLLIDVLENGRDAQDIALNSVIASDRVRYKKTVFKKQGLTLTPDQERALDAKDIDDEEDTPDTILYMD